MADEQFSMFSDEAAPITGKPASFVISKTINGGAQKVFDRWLIPVFLEEWMFGEHTGHDSIISLENTVRRGGDFCYLVNSNQHIKAIQGSYLELDIPSRLSFTWLEADKKQAADKVNEHPNVCHCTVTFEEQDDKTRLKLQVKVPATLAAEKESLKTLWTERCNALAARFKKT